MNRVEHRLIIPSSFEVQLQNKHEENIEVNNILCHLNIHIDESSFYTYSFIPTNAKGKVVLTKEQIIQNTGLKHANYQKVNLEKVPTKFDFRVLDKQLIASFISSLNSYLGVKPASIRKDLLDRGFSKAQINQEIPKALAQQEEDKLLYSYISKNNNSLLEYSEEHSKIEGIWEDEIAYHYYLKLSL